jgi:hypothetical protein
MTGAAVITLRASKAASQISLGAPIPAGANAIGSLNTVTTVTTVGSQTPVTPTTTFTNSAATTNLTLIKGSAGTLWSIVASNVNAATRYLKLFNKATAPVTGTDVPAFTIAIPAGGTVTITGGSNGLRFATGIGLAITANAADLDNTAVGAADVKVATSFT